MGARSTTGNIIHNSFWYGLETILELFVFLATSIAVARTFGPQKLGYFTAVSYPLLVLNTLGGTALAGATRKYMAEFLATGQLGLARAVYLFTYRLQALGSLGVAALAMAAVLALAPPVYRLMSCLLAISIIPGMMSWVPAQANLAFEDASKNTISGLGYVFTYASVIAMALHFGWDLTGVAAATLIGRIVEALLRTVPLHRHLRTLPEEMLPGHVRTRVRRFCLQAFGVQLVTSLVWNKSELFFLTALSDVKEVAYYGLGAGIADKLLLAPNVFGGATSVSLMTEAVRDARRVHNIVYNASRFLMLIVIPVNMGAAMIASQAITVAYGIKYAAAVPATVLCALFAIPRAFAVIPTTLLQAADRQSALLRWMIVTGVVNVAIDIPLIYRYGAVGAAIGNGIAQTMGVVLLWFAARRIYTLSWPFAVMARFSAAAFVMSAAVFVVSRLPDPRAGMALGIAIALPIYLVAIRLFRALEPSDRIRLAQLSVGLPAGFQKVVESVLRFATHARKERGTVLPEPPTAPNLR